MTMLEMSLPTDIPWKRIGASEDMIAVSPGYTDYPQPWQSSLALFYHEPDPAGLPESYCQRRITYLKVVATLSSFEGSAGEWKSIAPGGGGGGSGSGSGSAANVGLALYPKSLADVFMKFDVPSYYEEVSQVYPCYSALLQVGVFPPSGSAVGLESYPYIEAFEPKKREMYEAVSENGEVASQSASRLNVSKSATNTSSLDKYDLELGGGGENVSFAFGAISVGGEKEQKQYGDITRNQNQNQNVRTSDASRERRESHSFSTNINQIYSLLEGFHLGTNRATLLMSPRPHIKNQKFSFIRGLRKLEGVQEFFFVINRPDTLDGMCFEITLETAHGQMFRSYSPRLIPRSSLYAGDNLNKTAAALGIDLSTEPGRTWVRLAESWNNARPFYKHLAQREPAPYEAEGIDEQQWADILRVVKVLPEIGSEGIFTEDIALIWEEFESFSGKYFVVGRNLQSCATLAGSVAASASTAIGGTTAGAASGSGIAAATSASGAGTRSTTSESDSNANSAAPGVDAPGGTARSSNGSGNSAKRPLNEVSEARHITKNSGASIIYQTTLDASKTGVASPVISAWAANDLNRLFSETLVRSASSPERIPYGKLSYLESDVVLDALSHLIDNLKKAGIQDRSISEVKAIHDLAVSKDGRELPLKTLHDLSKLTTDEIARAHGLKTPEATKLRQKLLLGALEALDKNTLSKGARLVNRRIAHTRRAQIDEDRLKALEASAGLVTTGRVSPDIQKSSSLAASNKGIVNRVKDLIFGPIKGK